MPGIANRTVLRLRAQPGSLLSLLPVRNVKDQPVGGSRREQTHTYTYNRVHNPLCIHTRRETKTHARSGSLKHTPTLRRKHTRAWLTALSHHEGSSQAKPWGLSRDDSNPPTTTPRWVLTPSARWSSAPERRQNCSAAPRPLNVEINLR